MENTNKVEFEIQVGIEDSTDEELDRFTRQLLSELRDADTELAKLTEGPKAPQGSKGDPITIGSIALEVLPAAIPGVIALVQAWVMRGQGRTVKFKGKGIEFEGSPEELQKVLAKLDKGKRSK